MFYASHALFPDPLPFKFLCYGSNIWIWGGLLYNKWLCNIAKNTIKFVLKYTSERQEPEMTEENMDKFEKGYIKIFCQPHRFLQLPWVVEQFLQNSFIYEHYNFDSRTLQRFFCYVTAFQAKQQGSVGRKIGTYYFVPKTESRMYLR